LADNRVLLTRRSAIKRVVALLGGTLTATQLGLLSKSVAAMTADSEPRFLSQNQFLTLQQIVDLIIPETDTPGALGANVHHFVDLMLAEWASAERQARYVRGLEDIDGRARKVGVDSFSASTSAQRIELLQTLDKEAFAKDSADIFFGELKKMVLFAYYSSEPGATLELKYQRIPGDYLPCVPMEDIGRAWFWNGYSYEL
jgi:hypothetical protein